jgi:hypothetical protein
MYSGKIAVPPGGGGIVLNYVLLKFVNYTFIFTNGASRIILLELMVLYKILWYRSRWYIKICNFES